MRFDLRRLAVMLAGCAAYIDLYSPQGLLPLMADAWQLGPREASLTVTATTLAVSLVAPFAGSLADMIGRKRVIATAALLIAIPTFLAAGAGGFHELLVWRFVQGLLIPPVFAVVIAYIAEEWDRHEARAVTTLYMSGAIAGGFLGRFITGLVAEYAGWRGAFVALGVLNLVLGLGVALGLPRERRFKASGSIARSARAMLDHLANPQLLAACAVGFAVLFALVAAFTYVNFLLAGAPYGLGPAALGAVFAVYLLGMVTTPVSAPLLQRLGPRRFQALAVAISVAGVALTLVPSLVAIIAGLMVLSSGVFLSQAATTTYVGESVTAARSAAVGLYVMTYYIGGSLGAVLPGTAWHLAGWPGVAAVVALVQVAAGAIALLLWRDAAPSETIRSAAAPRTPARARQ
jgi:predicted MFS family arabinose efflux permease